MSQGSSAIIAFVALGVWCAIVFAAASVELELDGYLTTDFPAADGFELPIGDGRGGGSYTDRRTGKRHQGWYVATAFGEEYSLGIHPGEDWNGRGGGETDFGQPVRAIGRGRVVSAKREADPWGGVIVVEHIYYENHEKKRIASVYAHLSEISVGPGELVERGKVIGAIGRDPGGSYPAHLHLELRTNLELAPTYWPSSNDKNLAWIKENYLDPRGFIAARKKLFVPAEEPALVLVDQESYQLRVYKKGRLEKKVEVGLGQGHGQKVRQGDLKTPKGMYFVTEKRRGEFSGRWGAYYGGHWIKINYPNAFDAARALEEGWIDGAKAKSISEKWSARELTDQKTRLGGGIGFHGWIEEWEADGGAHLSWGCVVLHLRDVSAVFDQIPVGAMVVIM